MPKLEYDSQFNTQQSFKAGTTLTIHVDFSGVPTPSAQWKLNGAEICPSDRVSIKTNEYSTSIIVRGVSSNNSGAYNVEVNNSAGTAYASFDIAVKGMTELCRMTINFQTDI